MTGCYKITNIIYDTIVEAKGFVIWTGYLQDWAQRISTDASGVGSQQPSLGAAFSEYTHLT